MRGPRPRRVRFDAVVKIGGSLQDWDGLPGLVRLLADIGRRVRILVVPGGGRFADLVRVEQARLDLDESVAHSMGLRAMDQYGLMLAAIGRAKARGAGPRPAATPVFTTTAAARIAAAGRLPILLASRLIEKEISLERSFRLTSDAIAAFLAGRLRAPRLLLLKSVAGPGAALRGPDEARRLAHRGIVDPIFPELLPPGAATWIFNARRADQRADLIAALKTRTRPASRRPVRPPVQRAPRAPM